MKRVCSRCKKEFDEKNTFRMCKKCRTENRKYQDEWKTRNFDKPKGADEKIQAAKKRELSKRKRADILICSRCKKEFIIIYTESKKKPFKTCEICREKGRLAKKKWAASKRVYGTSKVDEIVKEVEEYNEAHGTHLTYGKYKELKKQNKNN